MNIFIPLGGEGKRFSKDGYLVPKPLIKVKNKEIIFWLLDSLIFNNDDKIFILANQNLKKNKINKIINKKYPKIKITFLNKKTNGPLETLYLFLKNNLKILNSGLLILDSDISFKKDIVEASKKLDHSTIFYKKNYEKKPIYSYIRMKSNKNIVQIKEKQKISNNIGIGSYYFNDLKLIFKILKNTKFKTKKELYISSIYKILINTKNIIKGEEFKYNFTLGTPKQIKKYEKI